MTELFDTNILIDNIKGHIKAGEELARHARPVISRVVWIELLSGARESDGVLLDRYLDTFRVLDISAEVADRTVTVRREYQRMKLPDAIIYATALVHGLTLVTRNTRDFSADMPNVRIPYLV